MKDEEKTRAQLVAELRELRRQMAESGKPTATQVDEKSASAPAKTRWAQSEKRFRSIVENLPLGVHMYQLDGDGVLRFAGANPAADRILGVDNSAFIGRTIEEAFPAIVNGETPDRFRAIARDGGFWKNEDIVYEDRNIKGVFENYNFQTSPNEMASLFTEITDRKLAELALAEERNLLRTLIDNLPDFIYAKDIEGRFVLANQATAQAMATTTDNLIGKTDFDFYPREMAAGYAADELKVSREGQALLNKVEPFIHQVTAQQRWLSTSKVPLHDVAGTVIGLVGVSRDVTEERISAAALRASEERFRSLVESTSDWIWEVDHNGTYTFVSSKVSGILGYEPDEVVGKTPFDLMPPEEATRVSELFKTITASQEPFAHLENTNVHRDGHAVVLDTSGVPIFDDDGNLVGYRGIDRDITEQKHIAEQLRQAQKMEAVGQLAGGVAHDFNNLLMVILGYVGIILSAKNLDESVVSGLQAIEDAAQKAARLTEQLLVFSRKQPIRPEILNLSDRTKHLNKMLRRLIREDIVFTTRLDAELGNVKADPGQIDQVIMNLVANARDAMPEGGEIVIETLNRCLEAERKPGVKPGDYILLSVHDTGHGMDAKTMASVFEPFFTTKERGYGTGLGLSTVHGIVKQNSGYIYVSSEVGKGTTFEIYLPRARGTADEDKSDRRETEGGSETIVVVEDEESVLTIISKTLEHIGYNVLRARSGREAIEIVRANGGGQIDLVITDVVMPGMNGSELADQLLTTYPGLKLIYMSGYTGGLVLDDPSAGGIPLLRKPFSTQELAQKVREALHSRRDPDAPSDVEAT